MAIAFYHTWTCYGTWLPGDARCWVEHGRGLRPPNPIRELQAMMLMSEDACLLDVEHRGCVEKTIADHCRVRGWTLHAVNCRTNHVHAVVTVTDRKPAECREQFKAWCTRKLKELEHLKGAPGKVRDNWWAERGWDELIDCDEELACVIEYVRDGQ
jgi:REP element-mobilizing transposase RayT